MYYVENLCKIPEYNLALEEFLCGSGHEIFMLWQNNPSVIIGRFIDVDKDVNIKFAESENIHIVRRNSGGGAVYHDLGNINYSFILRDSKNFTLEYFSGIIIKILESIGINAKLEFSHNDIKADGLKISGSAQYHHEGIILHHGSILFDSDLGIIAKVLKRSGSITNIRPLLNRDVNTNEFMNMLSNNICVSGKILRLSESEEASVKKLMLSKYLNPEWNMKGIYEDDKF